MAHAYEYDIAVLGGGSGGLVVASASAQLGAKVLLIEKNKLGGDCLFHGCVPSKTLIESSRVAWLVPVGMCVHPVLQFGGGGQPGDLLIAGVMATLAYLLAIYLFYGISVLAYREQYRLVIGATVVSIVVAMLV